MPQYIKTHSNYVLKSKHQTLGDGSTIWERDITTIGGLNQFAPGQTPIYRTNNFIITVRKDGGISNQYTTKKWKENSDSGETWTLQALENMVSDYEDQNDVKIVLKKDYYDFRDFVYYGSLSEMFRSSINDIIARFPGELFGTCDKIYYTTYEIDTNTNERIEKRIRLGGETNDLYEVSNPFGIDLHTRMLPKDADPIKYFADNGFKNYYINGKQITSWEVTTPTTNNCKCNGISGQETIGVLGGAFEYEPNMLCNICIGDKIADIEICTGAGANKVCYCLSAWMGDNNQIFYLSKEYKATDTCKGVACDNIHVTPDDKFLAEFRNGLNSFQQLILNDKTTPKYKATFSVIYPNDFGYYRQFEDFVFPTDSGGYNIDPTSYGFNAYTSRLADIGEFYDELFTDNLYRSLTHEAIKNFDWTYTREFEQGEEEEYVLGGQKIQKAIRIFAREFDEIISYINNIKTINRVTYDERDNLPDYFLTDTVENEGWNVQLVIPYDLTEYYYNSQGKKTIVNDYIEVDTTKSCVGQIYNTVNDSKTTFVREFVQNSTSSVTPYNIPDDSYFLSCSGEGGTTILTSCYYNKDNGDLRAIKVNGNPLTWYDENALGGKGLLKNRIKSYSSGSGDVYTYLDVNNEFLKRLKLNSRYIFRHKGTREGIEMILAMFGLKSREFYERDITYNPCRKGRKYPDYEIDEYWAEINNPIEDEWDCVHNMYRIDWFNSTKTIQYDYRSVSNYSNGSSMTDYLPYQGLPIRYDDRNGKRYLYPNFEKYEQYDGNPYFQMNGGWQAKQVVGSANTYNFQFDVEDNVVFNTSNDCADNLYKETVRNVRRFNTLDEMLSVPSNEVWNGQVVYVSTIKPNTAVVEGQVYEIKTDVHGDYIELIKTNGTVRVGEDLYFNNYIRVYGEGLHAAESTTQKSYFLDELPNGYIIKSYITTDKQISCSDDYNTITRIDFIGKDSAACTNYFELTDFYRSNRIYVGDGEYEGGWRRLLVSDEKYKKINTIVNDNKGNNPHNGNMVYDNGTEYFKYFEQLFKYALEEDLFDERCYENYEQTKDNEISKKGFTFKNGECNYYITRSDSVFKKGNVTTTTIELNYKMNHDALDSFTKNGKTYYKKKDTITNTILNTKVMKITFYLHYTPFSQNGQCEMKYLDDIVMNYLTQMIPSTTILQIRYEKK